MITNNKQRTLLAALAVATLPLAMTACGSDDSNDNPVDTVDQVVDSIQDDVNDVVDSVRDEVNDVVDSIDGDDGG